MLDHLGYPQWSQWVTRAIGVMARDAQTRTPDLGGRGRTGDIGDAVVKVLAALASHHLG